jgi:hypothetical protein
MVLKATGLQTIQRLSKLYLKRYVEDLSCAKRPAKIRHRQFSGCKIIFFDAGFYIVTSTVTIPAGTRMVGEAWSVLAGKGPAFQDQDNPQVIFRVGEEGSQGIVEITDIVFLTVGPGDFTNMFLQTN